MTHAVKPITLTKVSPTGTALVNDVLALEEPLAIRLVSGRGSDQVEQDVSVTMRTPGNDAALAAGFLFTEGIIESPDQVEEIRGDDRHQHDQGVTVFLKPGVSVDSKRLQRNFYTTSSCGVCGKSSVDAIRMACKPVKAEDFKIQASVIQSLPQHLRVQQNIFEQTGGLHAAALFDGAGNLIVLQEDVGRHNALDKVIGEKFLRNEIPISNQILMLSGRISFELVQKAAMAYIPVIAAIGAPSSLAVALATEMNITLLGF
ncbi:MAG: formate dehydrogenase accessory sulfurtransferase FdhD, partial [Cyclobacteriaceae bacterium]|nr:formate dehydrogenase accessory sulfurtransferase FdhD [Cyclobacteriaceae bacterium]